MSSTQRPPPMGPRYVGFLLTLLMGICFLVVSPTLPIFIVVLIIVGLSGLGILTGNRRIRNNQISDTTPPSPVDEDRYPDLNDSFTYQSNRPPERRVTPVFSYPVTNEKPPEWITHVSGNSVFQHALKALKAADQPIDTSKPLPIDLGFLVYRGDAKPNIHRTLNIPKSADSIQPYLNLHVPIPSSFTAVMGVVRFEIRSSLDKVLFSHEQEYTLKNGLNLITPPARFPIENVEFGDFWPTLVIRLGDTVIAKHTFQWGEMKTLEVGEGLEEDGEISDALRKLVAEQGQDSLTLDELLSSQEDHEKKSHP